MALSTTFAKVSCVVFIMGMGWLVNLVARPMAELPTPLVVRADAVAVPSPVVAGRFIRSSPVDSSAKPQEDKIGVAVAAAPVVTSRLNRRSFGTLPPPVIMPERPIVTYVDARKEDVVSKRGRGVAAPAQEAIPEEIVAAGPRRDVRMLAAVMPEQTAVDARAQGGGSQPMARYRVKRNDTLVKIMRRFWKSDDPRLLSILLAANPALSKRQNRIFPGEIINMPALESVRGSVRVAGVARRSVHAASGGRNASFVSATETCDYTIRKGDSLAGIARRVLKDERRWREIAVLNGMRNVHKIVPGMRIKLPRVRNDT